MNLQQFIKKYNGKGIVDDLGITSPEFKAFAKDFRSALKTELPGCDVSTIKPGHYDIRGFVVKDDRHIYVAYSVPRGERPIDFSRHDALGGVLYRTAQSTADYTGGINNFSAMFDLIANINQLFARDGAWEKTEK